MNTPYPTTTLIVITYMLFVILGIILVHGSMLKSHPDLKQLRTIKHFATVFTLVPIITAAALVTVSPFITSIWIVYVALLAYKVVCISTLCLVVILTASGVRYSRYMDCSDSVRYKALMSRWIVRYTIIAILLWITVIYTW